MLQSINGSFAKYVFFLIQQHFFEEFESSNYLMLICKNLKIN